MTKHYILQRYSDNGESTQGLLFLKGWRKPTFQCFTLEDEFRAVKVKGETRIPAGIYEVVRNEVVTPLTAKYRKQFPWFTFHLMLLNVPGFSHVYLHIGNDDDDTDACILTQDQANNNQLQDGFNGSSRQAFERQYLQMNQSIDKGFRIFLEVRDEDFLNGKS